VPADLVVLPDFWLLTEDQVDIALEMDWYECRGVLLVSQSDLGGDDPRDAGLEVDPDGNLTGRVKKIDQGSHRWNEQDGFYYV